MLLGRLVLVLSVAEIVGFQVVDVARGMLRFDGTVIDDDDLVSDGFELGEHVRTDDGRDSSFGSLPRMMRQNSFIPVGSNPFIGSSRSRSVG